MNNAQKGVFWSGLVFPGLGQIFLKHYKRGAVIMMTVLVGLSVIVVEAVKKAFIILEKIESEAGAVDMNTILDAALQASTNSDSLIFSFAVLLIILCWIIGVVDAFRIGRKKDLEEDSTNQTSNDNNRWSHCHKIDLAEFAIFVFYGNLDICNKQNICINTLSLRPQRFDGIQAGRLSGWIITEKDTRYERHCHSQQNGQVWNQKAPVGKPGNNIRSSKADHYPDNATD